MDKGMKTLYQLHVHRGSLRSYHVESVHSKVDAIANACAMMTPVSPLEYVTLRNSLIEWMCIEDKTLTIKIK